MFGLMPARGCIDAAIGEITEESDARRIGRQNFKKRERRQTSVRKTDPRRAAQRVRRHSLFGSARLNRL